MKELNQIIYKGQEYQSLNAIKSIPTVTSMNKLTAEYRDDIPEIVKQRFYNIRIVSYAEANLPPSVMSYRHALIATDLIRDMLEGTMTITPLVVAEVGTGSGLVPITIAKHLSPEEAQKVRLVATDISGPALEIATLNTQINGITNINLRRRNILEGLTTEFGKIDFLISNPPYSRESELGDECDFVPQIALNGGTDGLNFHRDLIEQASQALSDQGSLMVQCQDSQIYGVLGIANTHMSRRAKAVIPNENGGPAVVVIGNPTIVKKLKGGEYYE